MDELNTQSIIPHLKIYKLIPIDPITTSDYAPYGQQ